MQTRSRQHAVVASVALTLAVAACSSSTAPKPLTSQQVAQDIDQVYAAALAAGTSADSSAAQAIAVYFETGPAFGGTESSVTVTTASGAQTWRGVGFAIDEGSGDSIFVGAFYPNRNLQTAIVAIVATQQGTFSGQEALVSTDGMVNGDTEGLTGGAGTVLSASGTCALQSGLAADPLLTTFAGGAGCTSSKFQMSFAVTFPDSLGALSTVSVTDATINGPLLGAAGPSRVVGIPSKGAALAARLRALLDRRR
jgi:hypothetical protein